MSLPFLLLIILITKCYAVDLYTLWIITAGPSYSSYKFNVLQLLAAISPYFESNSNGLSPDPPQGCTVDKAAYIVRHGSIYANDYDYNNTILPFLGWLTSLRNHADFSKSSGLGFLTQWVSPISNSDEMVEQLTKSGKLEAFKLGTQLGHRYPNLLSSKKNAPLKIWVSASNRTRESGSALLAGLDDVQKTMGQMVIIPEEKTQCANTLSPTDSCPRFNSSAGAEQATVWLAHYTVPIIARLNAKVVGFQLSANDVLAM